MFSEFIASVKDLKTRLLPQVVAFLPLQGTVL